MNTTDEARLASASMARMAEPGDTELGAVIGRHGPVATVGLIRDGTLDAKRAPEWRERLLATDPDGDLRAAERLGARLVCPGEPEWPTQLDDLGDRRPYALWVKGSADLRFACLRSVSLVGARAATAYGSHVAGEVAATLAERGWSSISGGAYGIDGAAHRATLAVGGTTVVMLACGLDVGYPRGHQSLFEEATREGVLVSEWPPGATPTKPRFLVRNRVIAALSRGTVVVEAALRSGALNTARHAADLSRAVMSVPGPVTSRMSEGCHMLLREHGALCVTSATDVLDRVGAIGDDMAPQRRGPVVPRDSLEATTSSVLEAVPARGGGPASVARGAGVDLDTVLRCLGELAAGGFVERCEKGWRPTKAMRTQASGGLTPETTA